MALQRKPQKSQGTQLSKHKINLFRFLLDASFAVLDQDLGTATKMKAVQTEKNTYGICYVEGLAEKSPFKNQANLV
jgi:hypothetical protein